MKIYIYTIPKAGTYFLADFISRLGFRNTGWHVNRASILDTSRFDMETNAKYPSKAFVDQPYQKTLKLMRDGDIAFGHFPLPLMAWLHPDVFFVCAYRHPRQTLMSEFIDFRFRRADVPWCSPQNVPDDREAFALFLAKHGPNHMAVFSQMLAVTLLRSEPLCARFQSNRLHLLNFQSLLKEPGHAEALAEALGRSPDEARPALEASMQAETKTKATGLEIDRDALWSDAAEEFYAELNAEAYVVRGRELGWTI